MLAGLGGLQPLGWDPPLIQLTALPAGRYRKDAPYREYRLQAPPFRLS